MRKWATFALRSGAAQTVYFHGDNDSGMGAKGPRTALEASVAKLQQVSGMVKSAAHVLPQGRRRFVVRGPGPRGTTQPRRCVDAANTVSLTPPVLTRSE